MVFSDYNTRYSDSFSCFKLKEQLPQLQQLEQSSLEKNLVTLASLETRQSERFTAAVTLKMACVTVGKPLDEVLERLST